MAVFDTNSIREEWPIFELFRHGPLALFHNKAVLQETLTYFKQRHYIVHEFDCSAYQKENDVLWDVGLRLGFPYTDHYNPNVNGFNDFLGDVEVAIESGLILVFANFDSFYRQFPDYAHQILEIVYDHYLQHLLLGRRFMGLIQSNDPQLKLVPVGARYVRWNNREWLVKDRMGER